MDAGPKKRQIKIKYLIGYSSSRLTAAVLDNGVARSEMDWSRLIGDQHLKEAGGSRGRLWRAKTQATRILTRASLRRHDTKQISQDILRTLLSFVSSTHRLEYLTHIREEFLCFLLIFKISYLESINRCRTHPRSWATKSLICARINAVTLSSIF